MKSTGQNTVSLQPLNAPVTAEVTVPGSKSYTIRALLLAALTPKTANQPVKVINPLFSDDTKAILECLKALGIQTALTTDKAGHQCVEVHGSLDDIQDRDYTLNADLSAATLRFLVALSAVIPGRQVLLGKEGLNNRPVRDLVDSLRALGASIEYLEKDGYPPVRVTSNRIEADVITVSGSTSSQYISALMMIAPLIQTQGNAVTIELPGEPVSKPYLDMTGSIMEAFGVTVVNEDYRRFVIRAGQQYRCAQYIVEPDASSMAYFVAIAALTRSTITLGNINPNSVQADMRFVDIVQQMGNRVEYHGNQLTIHGVGVEPLHVDMRDCPDQAQTLAVLAAFAKGTTRIDGLQSLRVKETDRIAAVEQELAKMGIRTEAEADALVIHGGNPQAATIATYGDHRMAMAFAVAGTLLPGMAYDDPAVVNKTYPEFWQDLQQLGVGVEYHSADAVNHSELSGKGQKLVLTGFMGAGKTTVAALLAKKLDLICIEMDELIVQRSGRSSINDIFEQDGEPRFRELELEVAKSLQQVRNAVISTGGGIVMNPIAMDCIRENATVVFLETELETVLERLDGNQDRPLLQDKTAAADLYELRQPLYRQHACVRLSTDGKQPEALVDAIIQATRNAEMCIV